MIVYAAALPVLIGGSYVIALIYSFLHYSWFQFSGVTVSEPQLGSGTVFGRDLQPKLHLHEGDRLVKKRLSLLLYINERKRNLLSVILWRSVYYWKVISFVVLFFAVLAVVLSMRAV